MSHAITQFHPIRLTGESDAHLSVRMTGFSQSFRFTRTNPHKPLSRRESGSIFLAGLTRYGYASRFGSGWLFHLH